MTLIRKKKPAPEEDEVIIPQMRTGKTITVIQFFAGIIMVVLTMSGLYWAQYYENKSQSKELLELKQEIANAKINQQVRVNARNAEEKVQDEKINKNSQDIEIIKDRFDRHLNK